MIVPNLDMLRSIHLEIKPILDKINQQRSLDNLTAEEKDMLKLYYQIHQLISLKSEDELSVAY